MQTRTTQLEQVIEAYFAACDATRERFPLKSGGFSERQIPYTLYGLAHATGYAPHTIVTMSQAARKGGKERLFRSALSKIAAYTLERALLGELTHQAALQVLKDMGMTDAEQAAGGVVTIVMDEALKEYAK